MYLTGNEVNAEIIRKRLYTWGIVCVYRKSLRNYIVSHYMQGETEWKIGCHINNVDVTENELFMCTFIKLRYFSRRGEKKWQNHLFFAKVAKPFKDTFRRIYFDFYPTTIVYT